MGCDIHFHVEQREGAEWVRAEAIEPNPYHSPERVTEYPDDPWYAATRRACWYDGRNYNLFSVLANVRNGYGFAGCDTGDPLPVIHDPRGLPDDVTDEVAKESEDIGVDGHSHSWATVAELLGFDWSQPVTHRGWVDMENFDAFKSWGTPRAWSGMISGAQVSHITNVEMERRRADWLALDLVARKTPQPMKWVTAIEWQRPIHEACADFMPVIVRMAHRAMPDLTSVRAVYWFDN